MAKKLNTALPLYIDHESMVQLIDQINLIDEEAEISWNSFGGSVYAGQQFADFLNNKEIKLEANVTGIAASMGASLLPFFDKVKGSEQSDIMLHAASGGGGASIKHTNQFLYEALAKKINEETFKEITGHELKAVMLAEGDNVFNVWFTGKDAKKMGLFDEAYNLVSPKSNSLGLPANLGYELPEHIRTKYNQITKDMEVKDLTAAKLQAENPELYNSIIAVEQKRVNAIMKYAKYDIEKASELIKSGAELQLEDVEYFMEKKYNSEKIEELEKGSVGDIKPAKVTVDKEKDKEDAAFEAEIKAMREISGINEYLKK
jgi:ATP-dependent protease ClpP protease subunit